MSFFDDIEEFLDSGDPTIREWFLVKSKFWPFFLCLLYLYVVKVAGPAYMKNRKPYDLRKVMVLFNFVIATTYALGICAALYFTRRVDLKHYCYATSADLDVNIMMIVYLLYTSYLMKYAEFMDTIFFILRKKDNLITSLHVIHHFSLPIIGWLFLRTEKSGFQTFPVLINAVVHVFMYSYYALAAMGPEYRRYLWWKKYLTIAQMAQFVLLLALITIVKSLLGCTTNKFSTYLNIVVAVGFFVLFYNFYDKRYTTTNKLDADISDEWQNGALPVVPKNRVTKGNDAKKRSIVQSRI